MANESQDQSFPYNFTILPESDVASLKTIDGKVDPINMVEYKDKDDQLVTPLPLYIPEDHLEAELDKEEESKKPKHFNIMQTFLKMSSAVYSMAGLGSIEESKVYKDRFQDETEDVDSLKEEMNEFTPRDQQDADVASLQEEDDAFRADAQQSFVPSAREVNKSIDIGKRNF